MSWNQFLTEFVLRAMSNYQMFEEYKAQQMVEFARRAWDAMQAAELPESEKAKQAQCRANSPEFDGIKKQSNLTLVINLSNNSIS